MDIWDYQYEIKDGQFNSKGILKLQNTLWFVTISLVISDSFYYYIHLAEY